jgi:AcrR family transcriptional regulator
MSRSQSKEFQELVQTLAWEDLPHLHTLGRRERKAAETRVRLFRCALRLFAERGFQNVTVEDITEAADVGKGTFFNYFDSKDHVLGVMAEIQIGKVREGLAQAESGNEPVRVVLQHLFHRLAEEPGRSPDLARSLISSFLASEQVRALVDGHMAQGREYVARIFEIGQRCGEINPELKGAHLAVLSQQAVLGTILLWSLRGEPQLKTAMEHTFQHFWRAIATSKAEDKR